MTPPVIIDCEDINEVWEDESINIRIKIMSKSIAEGQLNLGNV
jgi:hypothetical protein